MRGLLYALGVMGGFLAVLNVLRLARIYFDEGVPITVLVPMTAHEPLMPLAAEIR